MRTNVTSLNGNAIALMIGLVCLFFSMNSQTVSGIFLGEDDFKNRKASYQTTNQSKYCIRVRNGFSNKKIKIKNKANTLYLSKDSIYGYITKTGKIFRFYKRTEYELLNYGEEIQLYRLQVSMPIKNQKVAYEYYFSNNSGSEIKALTIRNILMSFSDYPSFTQMIEIRYKTDNELIEYDTYHNQYKINRLLTLSKN